MTTTQLTSSDGTTISAYVAGPEDAAAGIVVIQEIFGVNPHIRSVVDRYAALGYRAIAPAFFDRAQAGVELGYDAEGVEEGRGFAMSLDWDNTMADVQAAIDFLGVPSGVVGYCWGGSAAWLTASRTTAAASVGYYGSRIPDTLDQVPTSPLVLHFGEHDHSIPLENVDKVTAAFPDLPVYVYDAEHGFNCDVRASYNEAAAGEALTRTLALFSAHLPAVSAG